MILVALFTSAPAMVATGYVAAWTTNLFRFRQRSLVERLFWSIPLSFAVTPIGVVLLAKAFSLTAAVLFIAVNGAACLAMLGWEWAARKRAGQGWIVGFRPLGGWALLFVAAWVAVAVLSLVDFAGGQRLFLSTTLYDHSYRVAWTEAILRTGVPPANPLYQFEHAAPMRTYYFWYAICAALARLWHLPARWVFLASCIWAGFALAALTGLYLKHFLCVDRIRRQFLLAVGLLAVTGLDLVGIYWEVALHGMPLPPDLEWWSRGQIASWLSSLLWVPHHVASLVCCMLALLLAWIAGQKAGEPESFRDRCSSVLLIGLALASGFGLSIYVVFAFALVMMVWAVWHLWIERAAAPVVVMAAGALLSLALLVPYLQELRHASSGNAGDRVFSLAVREMIPPEGLLRTTIFRGMMAAHPELARNVANLALLAPGYLLELGFTLVVLLMFLVPAWRLRRQLSSAQRALLVIAVASLILISFIRSWVLQTNDFGWRAALFVQFPLLLLGSDLLDRQSAVRPRWLRTAMMVTLWIGTAGTVCQALVLRFYMPLAAAHDAATRQWVHDAWVSRQGYAQLQRAVPPDAVVQYNPHGLGLFGIQEDLLDVRHPVAMFNDRFECGALWGGNPAGCAQLTEAMHALFAGGSADQARETCRRFGVDDLVVRADDAAWHDKTGWVWMLPAVVHQDEFRALRCR